MRELSNQRNEKGISIVEMVIVAAIIGILCVMAVPNFTKIRTEVYKDKCITHLRAIVAAKEHWSLETGAADTATPTADDLDGGGSGYGYIKDGTSSLVCPSDPNKSFATSYNINNIATKPACKIAPTTHVLP